MPKSKATISSSESEGSDDEPRQKKVKKTADKRPAEKASKGGASNDEETKYEIGRMRFVSVSEFRGRKMVGIREYYTSDDGTERPGKKGISLSVEQWEKLKSHIKDIDSDIKK